MKGRFAVFFVARLGGFAAIVLRAVPWLLLGLLLLVLAWRGAGWLWRLWPSAQPAGGLVETSAAAAPVVVRHWFGVAAPPAPPMSEEEAYYAGSAPSAGSNVRLLGVIAGGPRPAALLKIDNTAYEAVLGEEFADGWRLVGVEADAIRLLRNGREMRIVMPASDGGMTARKP